MSMGLPLFLLFSVYGVCNTYLPILLLRLGYTVQTIGILLGVFEAAGLVFPLFISRRVDRQGNYGQMMLLLTLLMVALLPPLAYLRNFWATAVFLALFAIGFKGVVPVSDALVSRLLGPAQEKYGRVRVLGSIGFVCVNLLLQFTGLVDSGDVRSIAFWIGLPALLFILSLLFIPGLMKRFPQNGHRDLSSAGPAPAVKSAPREATGRQPFAETRLGRLLRVRSFAEFPASFWVGILLIFLGNLGMTPSQKFLSLYVKEYLGLDSYAGLWALSAAAEIPFMFLSDRFIKKFGPERILLVSLVAISVRHLVYAVFPSFSGAVAGQLFHSLCFGLFHPAAIVFISRRAPRRLIAVAMTLYTSVASGLAAVIGNVMGGFVIAAAGYPAMFVFFSFFPLLGVAVFWANRYVLYRRDTAHRD